MTSLIIQIGIQFGDAKVTKWLTSLVISIITSIFLTQPLQVNKILNRLYLIKTLLNQMKKKFKVLLIAFFFVMIFRKYDETQDFETDPEDSNESLNKDKKWMTFQNVKLKA